MNDRIKALIKKFPNDIDGVLITSVINRQYFTSFKSSEGILVITRERAVLFLDFRYYEQAKESVKNVEVELLTQTAAQLRKLRDENKLKKIGIESGKMTVSEYIKYQAIFDSTEIAFDNKINILIENLRRYKDAEELDNIRRAQSITERAYYDIIKFIKPGRTEREIAARLEFVMKCSGSEENAFPVMVSCGKNTAYPHHSPTDYRVKAGDFIVMDFGAKYNGYCSDMTRTVALNKVTDEMKNIYNIVLKSQNMAISKIKPGISCHDIDSIAREYIAKKGFGESFGHSLGHAVGMEVHESPTFSPLSKISHCRVGHVMTVEPGIYIPDKFGVRIEDMVYIGQRGTINLTTPTKELLLIQNSI